MACATFLAANSAHAGQQPTILGSGAASCLIYLNTTPLVQAALFEWVLGYITAFNATASADRRVVDDENGSKTARWLATYCKDHPDVLMASAAVLLVSELGGQNSN
jgi:hypothetical protein